MSALVRINGTAPSAVLTLANVTRPYQNLLTYLDLPEPLFIAIIAAGTLLILITFCLITSRFLCKSACWRKKPKLDKKRLLEKKTIDMLLQNEMESERGYGKLDFLLGYRVDAEVLRVKVIQVSELPPSIDGSMDPYVIVSFSCKSNNDEKKTKIKTNSECPFFNQKFQFKVTKEEFPESLLTFKVLDYDKFGADALLGQLTLVMKDLDTSSIYRGDMEFSKMLQEGEDICQGMGQICIILNHTKAGLVVTVLEAKNLRIKDDSSYSLVFIRVKFQILKHGKKFTTKIVRETKKCPISQFPYFNEVLMFQNFNVPLGNCRLKFKVFVSGRFRMPTCLGYITLGSIQSSTSGQVHWESMLDSPRHPVAKWHIFVNPNVRE